MKKLLLLAIFIVVLASAVNAQGNVILTLRNVNTNEIVDGVVVYLDIEDENLIKYVEVGEVLDFSLDDGTYDIVLSVDDPSTPTNDYFKRQQINVINGLTEDAYLFPVGSVRGIVKDVFDNIVGNAELRFECANDIATDFPYKTDNFGAFAVENMPSCSCKVFASFRGGVGFTEIHVPQGNITDVEILLDRTIVSYDLPGGFGVEVAVVLLFIVILVLIGYKYRDKIFSKKKKTHHMKHAFKTEEDEKEAPAPKSSRAEDIKSTLNKKEKDIVDFLLSQNGETNQASIRHNTGIPRTSLSRIMASLEHKKVLNARKVGKVVKVKLTDWFLGKE